MLQDSIITTQHVAAGPDSAVYKPARPQTPYQVLRLLPKDATPAQQDSAIQAWFQPGEIHYSERPDTLHIPGHGIGRNPKDVKIGLYYQDNFFSDDTLYHAELPYGLDGVAGEPIPSTVYNSSVISMLITLCLIINLPAYTVSRNHIARELHAFFKPSSTEAMPHVTSMENLAMVFFCMQTCLLFGLMFYFYAIEHVSTTFTVSDEHLLIPIFVGVMTSYFLLKSFVYWIVNGTFFDSKRNKQLLRFNIMLIALEGLLVYPAVLSYYYVGVPLQNVMLYLLFAVVFVKIACFYKCFSIFFNQKSLYLQIILYFCALEITPLFALWGGLQVLSKAMEINY